MNDRRRTACIILTAAKGHRNAARALVGKAIRTSLGVRKWYTYPYLVTYLSDAEMRSYGSEDGRFTIEVTDAELTKLCAVLNDMAIEGGWKTQDGQPSAPVDIYHD